jgi:hypothetical protein
LVFLFISSLQKQNVKIQRERETRMQQHLKQLQQQKQQTGPAEGNGNMDSHLGPNTPNSGIPQQVQSPNGSQNSEHPSLSHSNFNSPSTTGAPGQPASQPAPGQINSSIPPTSHHGMFSPHQGSRTASSTPQSHPTSIEANSATPSSNPATPGPNPMHSNISVTQAEITQQQRTALLQHAMAAAGLSGRDPNSLSQEEKQLVLAFIRKHQAQQQEIYKRLEVWYLKYLIN